MGTKLLVPYKSQVGPNAGYSHNDCGPACVAMMLAAAGTDVTIDSMYTNGPAANLLQTGLVAVQTLVQLAAAYGVTLKRHNASSGLTLDGLRQFIDEGRPALMLIDYRPIVVAGLNSITTTGYFGHFAVAVGYEGDDFLIHDPYHKQEKGGYFVWSSEVLESCWNHGYGSSGNYYARVCLVPPTRIAEPEQPAYPVPEDVERLLRAKAIFEGVQAPHITNEEELNQARTWLGEWGQKVGEYTVKPNESLSQIAMSLYNNSDLWEGLAVFNGIAQPNLLEVNQVIRYPILPGMEPEEEGEVTKPQLVYPFTNQQMINAIYHAYKPLSQNDPDMYWDVIVGLGLQWMAEDRHAAYSGPDPATLALPDQVKANVLKRLGITA